MLAAVVQQPSIVTQKVSKEHLVATYGLLPHPEGGFYIETYRSPELIDTPRGKRSASTAIYFLVEGSDISRLHRIAADECWHFYCGSPLVVIELDEDSKRHRETVLGTDIVGGQLVQYFVKKNTWFGCHPLADSGHGSFSFVGCTVAPGFEFSDFELASREILLNQFDTISHDTIIKLTNGLP